MGLMAVFGVVYVSWGDCLGTLGCVIYIFCYFVVIVLFNYYYYYYYYYYYNRYLGTVKNDNSCKLRKKCSGCSGNYVQMIRVCCYNLNVFANSGEFGSNLALSFCKFIKSTDMHYIQ